MSDILSTCMELDDTWEETLEEAFFSYCQEQQYATQLTETYYGRPLVPGSIIMAKSAKSINGENSAMTTPHRMYVISSVDGPIGARKYTGFEMSSQFDKANLFGGHEADLYIDDFGTILVNGYNMYKPVIISIDDIYEFTDEDLDNTGVFKGMTLPAFQDFMNEADRRYQSYEDTSSAAWVNNQGIFDAEHTTLPDGYGINSRK